MVTKNINSRDEIDVVITLNILMVFTILKVDM